MFSDGNAGSPPFSVLGHYPDPGGGPPWGWRTEIEVHDAVLPFLDRRWL